MVSAFLVVLFIAVLRKLRSGITCRLLHLFLGCLMPLLPHIVFTNSGYFRSLKLVLQALTIWFSFFLVFDSRKIYIISFLYLHLFLFYCNFSQMLKSIFAACVNVWARSTPSVIPSDKNTGTVTASQNFSSFSILFFRFMFAMVPHVFKLPCVGRENLKEEKVDCDLVDCVVVWSLQMVTEVLVDRIASIFKVKCLKIVALRCYNPEDHSRYLHRRENFRPLTGMWVHW